MAVIRWSIIATDGRVYVTPFIIPDTEMRDIPVLWKYRGIKSDSIKYIVGLLNAAVYRMAVLAVSAHPRGAEFIWLCAHFFRN